MKPSIQTEADGPSWLARSWRRTAEATKLCLLAGLQVLALFVCMRLGGCQPIKPVGTLETWSEVVCPGNTNRLALVYEVAGRGWFESRTEYDFHSLAWKTRVGTNWIDRCVISKSAFQAGATRLRWVSDIDTLDENSGVAVIKVAEESQPVTNGTVATIPIVYSWREWSLLTNGEVRMIRICKGPFDSSQQPP